MDSKEALRRTYFKGIACLQLFGWFSIRVIHQECLIMPSEVNVCHLLQSVGGYIMSLLANQLHCVVSAIWAETV